MPLIWWGKYVAHDNNRDGLGVGLKLTQNVLRTYLEWHPTVLHDLHESQDYLYASTGAGPYNVDVDPVQTDEWWMLAKYEVSEMTKRGVPGVWTGGVLRRLDAQLPVLDRQHPQLHRPFLRDRELRAREPRAHR